MSPVKPIYLSALSGSFKDAAKRSDINSSSSLDSEHEIMLTAVRIRISNPGNKEAYDAFADLAKDHGYDLSRFPVDAYADICEGELSRVDERSLPYIRTRVYLSRDDRDQVGSERESIEIIVKPRSEGVVHSGFFSNKIGNTRELIYIEHFTGSRIWSSLYAAGIGDADKNYEPHPYRHKSGHYVTDEMRRMIALIDRAMLSLARNPQEKKLVSDLKIVKKYLQGRT